MLSPYGPSPVEQGANRRTVVNIADTLGQNSGNGSHTELFALGGMVAERNGVGHDDFLEGRIIETLAGGAGKHGMRGAGVHFLGAAFHENVGSRADGARGIDHVVHEHGGLAGDVADDVHFRHLIGTVAALVDDGEAGVHLLGEGAGTFHAAGVGGNHDDVAGKGAELLQQHGAGVQVIHGAVEEALNLTGMKIHRDDALGAGHGKEVGNELGADGRAGADLAVLTGIAEIRNDGGDAAGAGTLQRVENKAQFHKGLVGRGAGGLDDEHIVSAHAGAYFNTQLSVAERGAERRCEGAAEVVANIHGQLWIGRTRENFEVAIHRNMPS